MPANQLSVIQGEFTIGDDDAPLFALAHVQRHGTPFVLLVDGEGHIRAADRRSTWRSLFKPVPCSDYDRLPEDLRRLVSRHRARRAQDGDPTIALVDHEVVVSITSLDGLDGMYAFSIWHIRKKEAMEAARRRYLLTEREAELLEWIVEGKSSADISRHLSISPATVEWHTKRLLWKTDSQNRTMMAARVLGWLPDRA